MKVLLDTHLLLWAAGAPGRLPDAARRRIADPETAPLFSAASLWEVAIKAALGRPDFSVDGRLLRRGLLEHGWEELPIRSAHAVEVADLPPLHRDPFDRILVAQARVEGVALITSDRAVAAYPGPVTLV